MTYDLRRLRRKGFIVRAAGSNRYHLTPDGRRLVMFFTKVYARVVTPSLAHIDPAIPDNAARSPLGKAWRQLDSALEAVIRDSALAA